MEKNNLEKICNELKETFLVAGKKSLELRNIGLKEMIKGDKTPVTNADLEVNDILTKKINDISPDIPIISEESSLNKKKENLKKFWLIDPIDGTYDYINNKDEFTINAALIINNSPKLGMIYAPGKNRFFYTYGIGSSFELTNNSEIKLNCKKKSKLDQIKAVTYSNVLKPEILNLHKKFGVTEYTKMKSSYKFCVIATGEFDIYVAEPRASEWDIAAGHAIVKNAGGIITDFDGNEIIYGKKKFINPSLIVKRSINL